MRMAQEGFSERTRNTGRTLKGLPLQGDLVLEGNNMKVIVNLMPDDYSAGQAANKLRAERKVQDAMTAGLSAILNQGRVVLIANPTKGKLEAEEVERAIETTSSVAAPADIEGKGRQIAAPPSPPPQEQADLLEQLRKLGELRDQGVVTQEEFEAKKTDLLGRL